MVLSAVVAGNVRAEAARAGLTQSELARALGVSRMAVSDRYRGRTPWTLDELEVVGAILGLEPAEFLARPVHPRRVPLLEVAPDPVQV